MGGGRSDGRESLHPENLILESRMHANVPVRFGRGRLDSLAIKGLAAYLIGCRLRLRGNNPGFGNACKRGKRVDSGRDGGQFPDFLLLSIRVSRTLGSSDLFEAGPRQGAPGADLASSYRRTRRPAKYHTSSVG